MNRKFHIFIYDSLFCYRGKGDYECALVVWNLDFIQVASFIMMIRYMNIKASVRVRSNFEDLKELTVRFDENCVVFLK